MHHRSCLLSRPSPPFSPPPIRSLPHGSLRYPTKSSFLDSSSRYRAIPAPLCSPGLPSIAEVVSSSAEEEFSGKDSGFIEVGYVSSAHGIKGELRVKPSTDFPELRFVKPGKRWLRMRVTGKELISEVELIGGRAHTGQKSWIISLSGIDTLEEAKQIVGSTLLVREGDRPDLEEDEFYTHDLINMTVFLKETGRQLGTVVKVFNTGANDLLQVICNSAEEGNGLSTSLNLETRTSDHVVWIPFVKAIVPDIDMEKREMWITPPKGLLELNLRSDARSKKERRQLEWKRRKKLKYSLISAKKMLNEMGQNHVLEGLKSGEKLQRSSLANQLAEIDFKMLQRALQSHKTPSERYNLSKFIYANSASKNTLKISRKCLATCGSDGRTSVHYELYEEGLKLLMESKAALAIILNDDLRGSAEAADVLSSGSKSKIDLLQEVLLVYKQLLKEKEEGVSLPIIIISPADEIQLCEQLLSVNDYFGFTGEKVWFLEERKLPVVSSSSNQSSGKILLKSPWELIQSPIGSGGVFSFLVSNKIIEKLSEIGIQYVQVCSMSDRSGLGHPLFLGLVASHGADMGVKIFESSQANEEFDVIFSMRHLKRICKQIDELHFYTSKEQHEHVELVDGAWIDIRPDAPNSHRFHCSIYTSLDTCPLDNKCILHIFD